MKILLFNSLYYPNILGGAEKSVQFLAEHLAKMENITPVVVTTSNKEEIKTINGVKVYYIKIPNFYWFYESNKSNKFLKPLWHLLDSYNFFVGDKINNIIQKENPDVVHTNNLGGFSVYLWKYIKEKYNLPIIHTLRDYYLLCPKTTMFNDKKLKNCNKQCLSCKFYSITRKNLSKYVDTVVGISDFILNKHKFYNYFKTSKKTVIYNPVINHKLVGKQKNPINKYNLGYVGKLSRNKGIELLLNYFLKLKDKNLILNIYGKGDINYQKYLQKKFSKYDNIIFNGFKKSEEIYNNIDLLIVPSLWNEPFGRIIIEANSNGIPVLASKRGGIIELIKEGENGFLFNPLDFNNFKNQLDKSIETFFKQKKKLIFNTSLFDINNITKLYVKEYQDLINTRR